MPMFYAFSLNVVDLTSINKSIRLSYVMTGIMTSNQFEAIDKGNWYEKEIVFLNKERK